MKLTKKDFSCWGNGDKYDNELIIEHSPKIHSKTIADEILQNQKFRELVEEYLKVNPIDKSRTYYEYDGAIQDGRNDVKEDIIKFLKESKK